MQVYFSFMISFVEPVLMRWLVFPAGAGHPGLLPNASRELWHSLFRVAQTPTPQQRVPKAWQQLSIRLAPCHSAPSEPHFPRRAVSPPEASELWVSAEFAFRFPELGSRLVEPSVLIPKFCQTSFLSRCTAFLTDTTPNTVFTAEHHVRTSIGFHMFVFFTEMSVTF